MEAPGAAPHLLLPGPLDGTRAATMVTAGGRPVLVVPAPGDGEAGFVRAVDLATGAVLPDHSGLRREQHDALALGAGGLVATAGRPSGTVVVRDAVTGSPVGVPLPLKPRGISLTVLDGRPVVIAAGSGLVVHDVQTGAPIAKHGRRNGWCLTEFQGRHLLVAQESATSLRLYDALTGEPYGQPFSCDFSGSVFRMAAVDHDGRLLVAFLDHHAACKVSLWDVTTGAALPTAPPFDDVQEIDVATVHGRPLLLAARSGKVASPLTLWDLTTGQPVFPDAFAGYDGECARVALGSVANGFFAVTVDRDGSSALWVCSSQGTQRIPLTDGGMSRTALGEVDGSPTVALGGAGGALRLFDARTGREFSSPFYGGSPDDSVIGATGDAGRAVVLQRGRPMRLWDVEAGIPVARLDRSADRIAAGEVAGRRMFALVTGGRDSGVGLSLWDPDAGALVAEVSLAHTTADDRPADVVFTRIDDRAAVAVAVGRTVRSWDAVTGEPLGRPYRGLSSSVSTIAAGRIGDRAMLAAGGKDHAVHVFDPASGAAVVPPMAGHSQGLTALAFGTVDGRTVVASGSWDKTVRVWDAATGACVGGPWTGHGDRIVAVHVTERDGEPVVVSHAASGPPRLWRLRAPAASSGHTDAVHTVAAGRWQGRPVFASGGADRTVRLWDAATGQALGPALTDHAAEVTHVAFTGPDRDILVTGDGSGVVLRWQVHAGVPRGEPLARLDKRIAGISPAEVGGRAVVAIGTADGVLRIWDAVTSELVAELRTGADLRVSRTDLGVLDGRLVALTIGGDSPTLTLWDVAAGKPLYEPMAVPEECEVGTLATLDGRLVVVQGIDAFGGGTGYHPEEATDVQVIDVATRTVLSRHRSKRGWSHRAAVQGAVVLITAEDWIVGVNAHGTGGPGEFRYDGHHEFVSCVATADVAGRTIVASGDRGNALHFWDLNTRERLR
ncbi:WD40 repeat domain-containing protein [Actinoplanes sp. CA-051413]|uniref:WD40 repeat domain-containing protein n=1 Tax=Actinoplanes sp. CA-051413 TaxID=3239899 RepID=UPI003D967189